MNCLDPRRPCRVWVIEENDQLRNLLVRTLNRWDLTRCDLSFRNHAAALAQLGGGRSPEVVLLNLGPFNQPKSTRLQDWNRRSPTAAIIPLVFDDDPISLPREVMKSCCSYHLKTGTAEDLHDAILTALDARPTASSNQSRTGNFRPRRALIQFPRPMKFAPC